MNRKIFSKKIIIKKKKWNLLLYISLGETPANYLFNLIKKENFFK